MAKFRAVDRRCFEGTFSPRAMSQVGVRAARIQSRGTCAHAILATVNLFGARDATVMA